MKAVQSKFVRHKLPCPKCGGSDPVSMNEDKSAHCFSCGTHYKNYPEACEGKIVEIETKPKNTFLNSYTGSFGPLTDRDISRSTWKDPNHLLSPLISINAFWGSSNAFPLFMMTIHLNFLFPNDVLTRSSSGT